MTQQDWVPVDGYKALPVGMWLVVTDRGEFYVAVRHPNLTTVGGLFGFDAHKVTHYQALPEGPDTKEAGD